MEKKNGKKIQNQHTCGGKFAQMMTYKAAHLLSPWTLPPRLGVPFH